MTNEVSNAVTDNMSEAVQTSVYVLTVPNITTDVCRTAV